MIADPVRFWSAGPPASLPVSGATRPGILESRFPLLGRAGPSSSDGVGALLAARPRRWTPPGKATLRYEGVLAHRCRSRGAFPPPVCLEKSRMGWSGPTGPSLCYVDAGAWVRHRTARGGTRQRGMARDAIDAARRAIAQHTPRSQLGWGRGSGRARAGGEVLVALRQRAPLECPATGQNAVTWPSPWRVRIMTASPLPRPAFLLLPSATRMTGSGVVPFPLPFPFLPLPLPFLPQPRLSHPRYVVRWRVPPPPVKYPEEKFYHEFILNHGGSRNAYTSHEVGRSRYRRWKHSLRGVRSSHGDERG